MEDLKDVIAKNLVELRTNAKLTQLQLAEMLNYSDKAVSKWERGEAIPDIRVLTKIAEIYGVTLDDIVKEESTATPVQPKKHLNGKHIFITVLSAVLVWFIATGIFMIFYFIDPTEQYSYLVFVVAPLPTSIVLLVFSTLWGRRITNAISSSLIVWSCAVIFHVFVETFAPEFIKIFFIYIIAAVLELLVILWFTYRWYVAKHGKLNFRRKRGE
ncbi:MAG: helix-turn-helix domain-containing protein [Clostridia bacterium]|nr:helix-turn-helix domain-containing protein [Clostridia bacterium]